MKISRTALLQKVAEWDAGAEARFEYENGPVVTIPVSLLHEIGDRALPSSPGILRCGRQSVRWPGSAAVGEMSQDPIVAYAASGYHAARDMAELLSAQQAAQVQQAATLSDALTTVIAGIGDMLTTLVTNAMTLQANEGADERMAMATNALGILFGRGAPQPPPPGETEVQRLERICGQLNATDVAAKLRLDQPSELIPWLSTNFELVSAALKRVDSTSLAALGPQDIQWLQSLHARTTAHRKGS